MKKSTLTILLLVISFYIYAQTNQVETAIRKLEAKEIQALLNQDTVTLKSLWAIDYIVNAQLTELLWDINLIL
jgi:hypothetical protein